MKTTLSLGNVLVAGGSGFLGSHFSRALLNRGLNVVCVDNLSTGFGGTAKALSVEFGDRFRFVEHDVCEPMTTLESLVGPFVAVCNAASPASPPAYVSMAIETLRVGSIGTENLIAIALRDRARFLQFSTSEVYGDPHVHPQPESYWGHVNPIGMRSMYDESKRYAEALCVAHQRTNSLDLRLARIFNTYGPHMRADDGRVVTNLITQALRGEPLTIYGDGTQTRSFCYVDDEIAGLIALLDSGYADGPVNIGNPEEFQMLELAEIIRNATGSTSPITFHPLPSDDPTQRCPDISLASAVLGWKPSIKLAEGIQRTVDWFNTQANYERSE